MKETTTKPRITLPSRRPPPPEIVIPLLTLLFSLVAIYILWSQNKWHDRHRVDYETDIRGQQLVQSFETRIDAQIQILEFIGRKIDAETVSEGDNFAEEITQILTLYPHFQAINWIDPDWVIRRVLPLQGNELALGRNLKEHRSRSVPQSLQKAFETGQPQRTSIIDLLQGGKGFATYHPVRTPEGVLLGFLNGVFRIEPLVQYCTDFPDLRETFYFVIMTQDGVPFFSHGDVQAAQASPFSRTFQMKVVQQPWILLIAPSPSHLRSFISPWPDILSVAGICLALLVTALLHSLLRRNREIRESENRFRNLVEQASDAFYLADKKGRIRDVNNQACRLLGYTREEFLTMSMTDIVLGLEQETLERNYAKIEPDKPFQKESVHLRKDGTTLPVEVSIGRLDTLDDCLYLAIARDCTERKEAERQRQQIQKLEFLGVLAGGIAHDFNNLLLAIIGNAEFAREEVGNNSEARASLLEIEKAAHRAAELSRQMLAYSGRGAVIWRILDIQDLIRDLSDPLKGVISHSHTLTLQLQPSLPPVKVDSKQIRQTLMNLVINASESMEGRKGEIHLTTGVRSCDRDFLKTLELGDQLSEGKCVYIEVTDNGIGMDEETLKRVFDPFFSTKFTGRGLGIPEVLGIVRGHKGAMKVESEVGKGTTVTIYFPVERLPISSTPDGQTIKEVPGIGKQLTDATVTGE